MDNYWQQTCIIEDINGFLQPKGIQLKTEEVEPGPPSQESYHMICGQCMARSQMLATIQLIQTLQNDNSGFRKVKTVCMKVLFVC